MGYDTGEYKCYIEFEHSRYKRYFLIIVISCTAGSIILLVFVGILLYVCRHKISSCCEKENSKNPHLLEKTNNPLKDIQQGNKFQQPSIEVEEKPYYLNDKN